MYGLSIKEMDMVEELRNLHPSATILAGDKPCLGNYVCPTEEAVLICNNWLNEK